MLKQSSLEPDCIDKQTQSLLYCKHLRLLWAINLKLALFSITSKNWFSRFCDLFMWWKYVQMKQQLPNLTSALSVRRIFCPLMSRWITFIEWRNLRPSNISLEAYAIHSSLKWCFPLFPPSEIIEYSCAILVHESKPTEISTFFMIHHLVFCGFDLLLNELTLNLVLQSRLIWTN